MGKTKRKYQHVQVFRSPRSPKRIQDKTEVCVRVRITQIDCCMICQVVRTRHGVSDSMMTCPCSDLHEVCSKILPTPEYIPAVATAATPQPDIHGEREDRRTCLPQSERWYCTVMCYCIIGVRARVCATCARWRQIRTILYVCNS